MRTTILAIGVLLVVLLGGWIYRSQQTPALITGQLSAVAAASGVEDPRWQRVTEPRPFVFPDDHGQHPEYQTEWWYYTGNVTADNGREFGFQLTFFRRGLDPEPAERTSNWATRNIYLAHFTVSDIAEGRFFAAERFSRDGAELAGATGNPYRVWLGPWQATGSGPEGMTMRLQAAAEEMAIDLRLESTKPVVLQGDQGFSQKGSGVGNASYYYSLTRMASTGTVSIGSETYRIVDGLSWMDHEWGTSRLEESGAGWDWFALILDDGREVTWAQLRRDDGTVTPASFGSVVAPDGSTTRLSAADATLEVLDTWRSPRSGAVYPAEWQLTIPGSDLSLRIRPRLADQELPVSIVYWEGSVMVEGEGANADGVTQAITGRGYVELTGYVPAPGGTLGR
jgi:predicted secreted hydrolase